MKPALTVIALAFAFVLFAGPQARAVAEAGNEPAKGSELHERDDVAGAIASCPPRLKRSRKRAAAYPKRDTDLESKDAAETSSRRTRGTYAPACKSR